MSEPGDLAGQVRKFLDRDAQGLLLTASAAPGRYPRVAVVVPALRGLRFPAGVKSALVGLFLEDDAAAVTVVPRPEWPALTSLRSRTVGDGEQSGRWTVFRFAAPVDVAALLTEVGRQSVWGDRYGHVMDVPPDLATSDLATSDRATVLYDERVFNPIGFLVTADGPIVDASTIGEPTAAVVRSLRANAGVRVPTWDDATTRTVAALAMAGIPIVAETAPEALGSAVAAAITAPVDLTNMLAREEHSVVLRRAAFETFSIHAWRSGPPSVSIVLATKRADMLDFALAQVARQRGVEALELVLAPHGFDVPVAQVQEAVGLGISVQVVTQPEAAIFGDALDAAARAAGGDVVLKMDDDDWYAPDFVADLLRARAYSGAELVGMPPEFHYLTEQDLTVTRGHPSEVYHSFVAGGTMLVDRSMLREVGGFRPVRKYVDAQLLDGVLAAGGAIYRTHGLGYVLRRNPTGHTWQADLDFLLDPARTKSTRPGFHPSRLLELSR